jgi:hypothetical protein
MGRKSHTWAPLRLLFKEILKALMKKSTNEYFPYSIKSIKMARNLVVYKDFKERLQLFYPFVTVYTVHLIQALCLLSQKSADC